MVKRDDERGQILIIFVLMIGSLLGMIGLAIDAGYFVTQRRQAQNVADAAALAAAERIAVGATVGQAQATALSYAAANGYDNDGTTNTVTVHIPPTSGSKNGNANYAEVIIDEDPNTFFIHAVAAGGTVRGRGVAGSVTTGTGSYALLVLNNTLCNAYNKTGSANFNVNNGGGIMVNSSCNPGINQTGSGSTSATIINYYASPGGWNETGSGSINPTPTGVSARIADPLASIAQPVPGVTVGTSLDSGGTAVAPALRSISGSSPVTLRPGTYWGGLSIAGSGNVTFQPGLYIFAGGGFTQTGSGNMSGTGVTFYSTQDPSFTTGAGAYNNFDFAGSGSWSFSGPTSGSYKNIIWWQDKNAPNDTTRRFNKSGSGNLGNGIVYLPNAKLNLTGSGNIGSVQIIVDALDAAGSGNLTVNYASYVSMGTPDVVLVE
jgi:Flp pilus assembly protein TadG